jgi:transcriptional regulator with XRE-family HTH domain
MARMVKLTRLKDVRQRKALTQQQLAERAGVNRVTIARIEGGKDEPFPTTVRKVADALGVEPEELLEPASPVRTAPVAVRETPLVDQRITILDEEGVLRILQTAPGLVELVEEAADQLLAIVPDARLRLERLVDPEDGDTEQLLLGASTDLDVPTALDALRRFDQEWWLHNVRRATGLLIVDLD